MPQKINLIETNDPRLFANSFANQIEISKDNLFKYRITGNELISIFLHELGHILTKKTANFHFNSLYRELFADQFVAAFDYNQYFESALTKIGHSIEDPLGKEVIEIRLNLLRNFEYVIMQPIPYEVLQGSLSNPFEQPIMGECILNSFLAAQKLLPKLLVCDGHSPKPNYDVSFGLYMNDKDEVFTHAWNSIRSADSLYHVDITHDLFFPNEQMLYINQSDIHICHILEGTEIHFDEELTRMKDRIIEYNRKNLVGAH